MADRTVSVKLLADAQQYLREIRTVHDETVRQSQSIETRLQAQATAYQQVGAAATLAGGVIVTGLGLAAKAAIDWESAWAGVLKTVDASPETFAVLEQDLRDLTGVLPATHAEIAAVAEAAGQLGISAENIPMFTKVMIDMGESTNLSSEAAATSLARFMNIMGTSQDRVGNLGSAVVDLGNNYATTEAEIVEMSMRLAGAGTQIGLSEGEVLGLSAALSSVGIEAEAGGSAMSKVMIDIAASVEEGGDRLDQFSTVAGVSATEFADAWRTDPGAALALFVQGLSDAESQGSSTLGILAELGITEVRMRDALLRASAASDTFTTAMQDGNDAFDEGNALADEAARRYETLGSQFEITRNQVVDAAISFGETLTPAIGAALGMAGDLADFMGGLPAEWQGVITVAAGVTGAVLLLGGTALLAIPKIAEFHRSLRILGITSGTTAGALGRVTTALAGPWGIAIAAAATGIWLVDEAQRAANLSADEWVGAMERGATATDLFALANREWIAGANETFGIMGGDSFDVVADMEQIPAMLERLSAQSSNFWEHFNAPANMEFGSGLGELSVELGRIDTQLAAMDPARAREGFDALAEGMGLSRAEADVLLGLMSGVAGVLEDTDTASEGAADGIEDVGEASETAAEQAQAFLDTQKETADLWLSSVDAAAAFEQQIDDIDQAFADAAESGESLTASWDEQNDRFDIGTQKGRDAHDMLSGLVDLHNANVESMVASGASAEELEAAQARANEEVGRLAGRFDETGQAAETYTGLLNNIPDDIATAVELETARAQAALNGFMLNWDGKRIRMYVDTYGGARYQVQGNDGRPTDVYFNASGNILDFAGAARMSPVAQMVAPNSLRFVGDRTDVDEAYIPLDRSPRSFSILDETIRRMGAHKYAEGGFFDGYGSSRYGAPQYSPTFNPTINMPAMGDVSASVSPQFVRELGDYVAAQMQGTGRSAVSAAVGYTDAALGGEAVVRR